MREGSDADHSDDEAAEEEVFKPTGAHLALTLACSTSTSHSS
jgi:hypothetical protein